jgi:hypothetical protein
MLDPQSDSLAGEVRCDASVAGKTVLPARLESGYGPFCLFILFL